MRGYLGSPLLGQHSVIGAKRYGHPISRKASAEYCGGRALASVLNGALQALDASSR